jgi:hypothetical protein
MSKDFRSILDALMPEGAAWNVMSDGDLDNLLNAIADNQQQAYDRLSKLAKLRDPAETELLSDLEREYGILSNENLSEAQRRLALAGIKYAKPGFGADDLQQKLRAAGFENLFVYQNDPTIDPDLFMTTTPMCCVGGDNAYIEEPTALIGYITPGGGELIVRKIFPQVRPLYLSQVGGDFAYVAEPRMVVGYYLESEEIHTVFEDPGDPDRWRFIFYVGGEVSDWTNPPIYERAQIPMALKPLLISLILKYKPIHTWCLLVVDYV